MSTKQLLLLLFIYFSLGTNTALYINNEKPKQNVCYTIIDGSEHSYMSGGKYPSWQVKVKVESSTGATSWRTVDQSDIDAGKICDVVKAPDTVYDFVSFIGAMFFGFFTIFGLLFILCEMCGVVWNWLR